MAILTSIRMLHPGDPPFSLRTAQFEAVPREGEYIRCGTDVVRVAFIVHEHLAVQVYVVPAELPTA